jgi:hypothetical protein
MFTLKKSILGYMELKPIQFQFGTNIENQHMTLKPNAT